MNGFDLGYAIFTVVIAGGLGMLGGKLFEKLVGFSKAPTPSSAVRIGYMKAPPGGKISVEVRGNKSTIKVTGPGAEIEGDVGGKPLIISDAIVEGTPNDHPIMQMIDEELKR